MKKTKPKILFLDIETSPLIVQAWGLFDQNFGLNQVQKDWELLSWAAKWSDSKKVMYQDRRNDKNDSKILVGIWKLLDEADIVVGQNSIRFDVKKLMARFVINGFKPPSPFRQLDTLSIAKKFFALTSNKLEYLSTLNTKYKKLKHSNFAGHELWSECLKGNKKAWAEMEKYNKHDVLAMEEVFWKLQNYDSSINFDSYSDEITNTCACGSDRMQKRGYTYSKGGRFQRFLCLNCGKWSSDKQNLLTKEKKKSIKR